MSNFIKKPSLSEQRKEKRWTLSDVVRVYGNTTIEELKKRKEEYGQKISIQ
jgi:hypothetical protein